MFQKTQNKDCCKKSCSSLSLLYVLSLLLVAGWMAVIFSFSAEPAHQSSELSQGFTMQVLEEVQEEFPEVITEANKENLARIIETPIRKMAHFSEYAVLGILVSLSLLIKYGAGNGVKYQKGIIICCLYAISDEVHQVFVPGRAGRLFDVGVDTTGAAFGTLIFYIILFIIKKIMTKYCGDKEIRL